ncbi:hypothetical protein HOLleu_27489 [Holothuria leucospilota]|uniref:Uncharacterized protein n=1 Tax=Holothuria leucospilota TaxID=206669 RepID=A0A9Q1BQN2_HOLLE|nr:hypothetical protein HOLleu_27489 [Holothuria leucospilota]
MELSHFRNGKSCAYHSYHGYSCAIDAQLELYFYSIFVHLNKDYRVETFNILNRKLHETCVIRKKVGMATCAVREPVWHWLCQNIPHSYSPKGRYDAEIMSGLQEMANESNLFGFKIQSDISCCNSKQCMLLSLPLLTLSHACVNLANGILSNAIESQVTSFVKSNILCKLCQKMSVLQGGKLIMSEFQLIELAMVNAKNLQNPPIRIDETIHIFDETLELVGAVVMEPDHFITVSKVAERFVLFDGVLENPVSYASFAGAVQGNGSIERSFLTSPHSKYGVHVLLYKRVKRGQSSVSLLSLKYEHPVAPNGAKSSETVDLTDETDCSREVPEVLSKASIKEYRNAKVQQRPVVSKEKRTPPKSGGIHEHHVNDCNRYNEVKRVSKKG